MSSMPDDTRPGARGEDRLLIGVMVLAAALRFATLSTQSLWSDEGFTAQIAAHSFGRALSEIPHTESTPPLYYVLVWVWAHVFGDSAFALRSLSAVFGTLTVGAVYWVAAPVLGRRVALGAAGLAAVSPIMVWYAQEARAYALMVLLCVLALGCCLRALEDPRRGWLIGWAVLSAAALATHYFAAFPVAAEGGWLLLRARGRRVEVAAACGLPLLVGAALVPLLLYQSAHVPRPWTGALTVTDQLLATGQSFLVGITWTPIIHRAGVAVLGVLAVAAVVALARGGDGPERRAGRRLAGLGIVILGVPLVVSLVGTNYLAPRNLLYVWPLLAMLVAAGALRRSAGWISGLGFAAGVVVSITITIAVPLTSALQRQDWRDLVAQAHGGGPRAIVALDGFDDTPVLRYYLPGLRRVPGATFVREIDIVSKASQVATDAAAVPVRGLTPAGVRVRGQLALARFVSPLPVRMPPAPPGSGASYLLSSTPR